MADYPDFAIGWDSEIEPVQDRVVDITQGGNVKQRRTYDSATIYRLTVEHPLLSSSEAAALVTFYEANRDGEFLFSWPLDYSGSPHDYRVRFVNRPIPRKISPEYSEATVELIGVRT